MRAEIRVCRGLEFLAVSTYVFEFDLLFTYLFVLCEVWECNSLIKSWRARLKIIIFDGNYYLKDEATNSKFFV